MPSTKYFRRSELLLQGVAIVLAVIIVAATPLVAGTVVRMRTVPIQVTNLARDLRIQDQSAVVAQVQLRGNSRTLDSIEGTSLTARADVQSLSEGVHDVGLEIHGRCRRCHGRGHIAGANYLRLRVVKESGMNPSRGHEDDPFETDVVRLSARGRVFGALAI